MRTTTWAPPLPGTLGSVSPEAHEGVSTRRGLEVLYSPHVRAGKAYPWVLSLGVTLGRYPQQYPWVAPSGVTLHYWDTVKYLDAKNLGAALSETLVVSSTWPFLPFEMLGSHSQASRLGVTLACGRWALTPGCYPWGVPWEVFTPRPTRKFQPAEAWRCYNPPRKPQKR